MGQIDRTAIRVVPREPYGAWATEHGSPPLTVGTPADCRSIYLIEGEPGPDAEALLRRACAEIFEHELFVGSTDRATWPRDRSWNMFRKWFHAEVIEVVVELDRSGPQAR